MIDDMERDDLWIQRQLAAALRTSLGAEGALQACREMGWHGALGCLLKQAVMSERAAV